MKGLVFHWDENEILKADKRAQKRLLKQWTHTAKAFGIYNLLIIGDEIPINHDSEVTINIFKDYLHIRKKYSKYKYVVITEEGDNLKQVKFPTKNVLFVLGSNYSNPQVHDKDIAVSIEGNIPLWDVVAAGIVLHEAY